MALPGTLLPPTIFAPVALAAGWTWQPLDWLAGPGDGDLEVAASEIVARWPARELGHRVLVGHSAGGVVALQVAAALGARLDGLVLIGTGASAVDHGDPDLPQRLLAQWGEAFINAFLLRCVGRAALDRHGDALRRYALATGPERAHRAMTSLRGLDLTPQLGEIRCPTLIVHGQQDPARSLRHAQVLASGIADARLETLDAGHTPMLECPDALAACLDDFLSELG
ncbi:alpha/beta fold hydrolase [Salinicola corii]|uniref:Alpha/beta fold hydrolase n=1 Tax=Salinicola corii TaxID=2606937 RepID=A0A640WH26_9GAMM|nr:alpha/beta hydrolase [Salinicola corii]KAA0019609.1 alpha/beta fold hydrolase [Salinicola corii]